MSSLPGKAADYFPYSSVRPSQDVFTASYEVLRGLLDAELEDVVDKPLFSEYRAMSSKENELLVNRFRSYASRGGAVLLGVQGGRSSEEVHYPGITMNSVAVVGSPTPNPPSGQVHRSDTMKAASQDTAASTVTSSQP